MLNSEIPAALAKSRLDRDRLGEIDSVSLDNLYNIGYKVTQDVHVVGFFLSCFLQFEVTREAHQKRSQ